MTCGCSWRTIAAGSSGDARLLRPGAQSTQMDPLKALREE